jgi:glycosyltransferase involved in cell wall biosynthesis
VPEPRVLYVNQTSQVSGAERSLLALLDGLGDAVSPVVACPPGQLADEIVARGLPWREISGTRASFRLHPVHTARGLFDMGRSALQLRRIAKAEGVRLIHANTTRASLLAILTRRRRPPLISHNRDWVPAGRLSRAVLAVVGRGSDLVVANSAWVAAQFDGLRLRRPVRVIHNPVDLGRFDPTSRDRAAARRGLGVPAEATTLAMVAQLTPWKAQDDAIRALATLVAGGRDVVLLLAGSAKFAGAGTQFDNRAFERDLHALAARLGVAERVLFLGETDDVPSVLAATDVLLLPSWREAFGRVVIEGMAMGVPVVATEVGGPAEIIDAGVDGLLLPPRDPERWGRELATLVDDPELRRRMGVAARRRAAEFGIDRHVEQVLAAYRELLEGQ